MAQLNDPQMQPIKLSELKKSLEDFRDKYKGYRNDNTFNHLSEYLHRIDGVLLYLEKPAFKSKAYDEHVTPYYFIHFITYRRGYGDCSIDYSQNPEVPLNIRNEATDFEDHVNRWDVYSGNLARRQSSSVSRTVLIGTALTMGGGIADAYIEHSAPHALLILAIGFVVFATMALLLNNKNEKTHHISLDGEVLDGLKSIRGSHVNTLEMELPSKTGKVLADASRMFQAEKEGPAGEKETAVPRDDVGTPRPTPGEQEEND